LGCAGLYPVFVFAKVVEEDDLSGKKNFFQCIDSCLAQTVLWLLGTHVETLASP
jgi:hypothetical protein